MATINPRVDVTFKKLFGVEENKDLLISLINSIVSDDDQVKDIHILNPYNIQNFKNDKLSILNIKARGHNDKLFNIEIQISDEADYDKRALYYWSKLYIGQMKERGQYSELNKAIAVYTYLTFYLLENLINIITYFILQKKKKDLNIAKIQNFIQQS